MKTLTCILFAACLLGCADLALAQSSDGEVQVHGITLRGVRSIDEAKLRAAIATRRSSRLPWGRKRYFDQRAVDADVLRIQAFYADRGFPDARVTAADITYNRQRTSVDITISIDEGAPLRVAGVELAGFEVIPPDHLDGIRGDMPLRPDRPRDRALVVSSHDVVLNELRDHGYPYARVTTSEAPGPEPGTTTVRFAAEPGILAHFGDVQVVGNKTVGANVIRRQIDYRSGDLYRRSVLLNTQRRLYGLALFQFVNVTTVEPDPARADVRTQVSVTEGKHQRVNASVGYGSEDKARVDGEYRHVNFLGGARSAGVHGRWSSFDRGVRADFTQPYLFDAHLSLGTEAQRWYTFVPAYKSVITGARMAVTHISGPNTSVSVFVSGERSRTSIEDSVIGDASLVNDLIALGLDPSTGTQDGTLSAIGFDLRHAKTDNLLNPRKGYQLALHGEEAGILLPGTFNYYALTIDGRHYQPVGDRLVLATHVQAGNIGPIGSGDVHVPFAKKYFLGGATTLRGWGRFEVSPLSSSGIPVGGDSFMALSAEARADVKGSFGAALFLDAGNVWMTSGGFALNDLRYSVGPGFRYRTPVGPVRFDVGYQLNPIPGLTKDGKLESSRWRFNFSIGEAF